MLLADLIYCFIIEFHMARRWLHDIGATAARAAHRSAIIDDACRFR